MGIISIFTILINTFRISRKQIPLYFSFLLVAMIIIFWTLPFLWKINRKRRCFFWRVSFIYKCLLSLYIVQMQAFSPSAFWILTLFKSFILLWKFINEMYTYLFSSPEQEAQMNFSAADHLSSVCLSVFSHFPILLQLASFNQTWHKATVWEGYSSLFKWRATTFLQGK